MIITLWTATVDSMESKGIVTSVHLSEGDALESLNERYGDEPDEPVGPEGILEWMTDNGYEVHIDSHQVDPRGTVTEQDEKYVKAAREQYELSSDGDVNIDFDAIVSYNDEGGAYVGAWVYVRDTEVPS